MSDDEMIADLIYTLSRSGQLQFDKRMRDWPEARVVRLYERIREEAELFEMDWRDQFVAAFPRYAAALPKSRDEEVIREELLQMIEENSGLGLSRMVETAKELPGGVAILRDALQRAKELDRTVACSILEEAIR